MNMNKLHIDTPDTSTYTIDTRHHLKDIKDFITPKRVGGAALVLAAGITAGVVRGEISTHMAPENNPTTHTITVQENQTLWGVAEQIERGEQADVSTDPTTLDQAAIQKEVDALRIENKLNSPELGTGDTLVLNDSEYEDYLGGTQ